MSSTVITRQASDALDRVMQFFGVDAYNRPLFGIAARDAGVDAFCRTIEALDKAIAADQRSGLNRRIRERIDIERELKKREKQGR